MIVCDMCGEQPPHDADTVPLTWLISFENGVSKTYCPDCARANIRSIEAKLDSEWW